MDIVCACDEKFLPHTATMLCSLFENNDSELHIFLLHNHISQKKLDILSKFIEKKNNLFTAIEIDETLIGNLMVSQHASIANYYRLLIPEVLPDSIDKVLYLDSDLIVRKDITELWNIDLKNYSIAAVEDLGFTGHTRLKMPLGSKYFNSGVMLINLARWRKDNIHFKVIDFIGKYPDRIRFWDQDGLNAILANQWKALPIKWNVQHNYFFPQGMEIRYADINADPAIVHFSGEGTKPWLPYVRHKYIKEYLEYENMSPFRPKKFFCVGDLKSSAKKFVFASLRKITQITPLRRLFEKLFNALNTINNEKIGEARVQSYLKWKEEIKDQIEILIPDLTVASGPFKGMKYPEINSFGSTIAPKLFGTYEAELEPIIEQICAHNYSTIINIGSAEGYYSIGLAIRNPKARVFAYDIDLEARNSCRLMASVNGVSDRVTVSDYFTLAALQKLECPENGLILSDCEGAEKYIFYNTDENWKLLIEKYDLLIEIHEFIQQGVTGYIKGLFADSHTLQVIRSIDDILRPYYFSSQLLQEKPFEMRVNLMAEKRPTTTEWFFMERRKNV